MGSVMVMGGQVMVMEGGHGMVMEGGRVEEAYRRTFGSRSFTSAPRRHDRPTLENERAARLRDAKYPGQREPPPASQLPGQKVTSLMNM